jgi:uroporphyrinogen-III decarboxylase
LTEHPVKTKEDFKTLIWMFENMSLHPSMDNFIRDYNDIGNRGLCMPVVGTEGKTSFQSMVESWVGTEELVYFLEDCPEAVEECLAAMQAKALESVAISVDSPAEAFIFWEDSSTQNISPGLFRKYSAPEIEGYAAIMKPAGKKLVHHACGHIKSLIPLMAGTGIDCIESITPPPTGNIELSEAFDLLPEHIALIGGIDPVFLLNASLCELRGYVEALIKNTNGRRFILANSDSCPPGVAVEKFMLISEVLKGQDNI